ncbi:PREDICTED: uncharacterized protein LOC109191080 [Ipomoea nil]|uniref:uncharacterized protein LOC109191080 n=1 Tax=Ipomoea nil TaxID=35883 RepID=UPI0009014366|nr:PREDICTED: uncharacterized protein LOC109191080 [Ipomoea nil]
MFKSVEFKEETTLHIFTECIYAKAVWSLSGLPLITHGFNSFAQWLDFQFKNLEKGSCCLLLMLCWKLWTARNDKVWNGSLPSPSTLVEGSRRYLANWTNIVREDTATSIAKNSSVHKWDKPSSGFYKLNTDVAVSTLNRSMGFGWVLRNDTGQFVAAECIPGKGVFTPKEAEAMAIREALSWIKREGITHLQIESDALEIIQSLKQNDEDSSCDLILLDIKDLLRSIHHVAISYVSRTANVVAHSLAREACSMSVRQEWISVPPSFIVNELYSDLN